jgi:2-methylcitrate dehydratase PrpD
VTVAERLAERGLVPLTPAREDALRTLTLANLAAAAGKLGNAQRLIDNLPLDLARSSGDAAFIHAMRLHARTQDDFHPSGRVHVGAAVLAAALALSDRVTDRLLECLSAGYEVMCAVGVAYAPAAQARGFRPTGIFAPFGAAASAAVALGLDDAGIANSIALAASMTAGTNQSWISGTDEWLLELGCAARAGVEAALFTAAGATAAPDALEGRAGWASAFCDDDGASKLTAELSNERSLVSEVAVKPYPVSGIAQIPTHLACMLHEGLEGALPDSLTLRISVPEANYPGSRNRGPFRSRSDALMSVSFCLACGITNGRLHLEATEQPNQPELLALLERIHLEADPALEETQGVLVAELGDRRVELVGEGAEIFHPTWQVLSEEADALADRSEAPVEFVRAVREQLVAPAPDCASIARLLEAAW